MTPFDGFLHDLDKLYATRRPAIDYCRGQAFSDDYPKIVGRFHQVERDIFLVAETHIDLRTNSYETED